ncbi:hypothetical protein [Aeromonas dhakensis]|uniref:hypothetical protein n=1 Tax=Aeromonas dhakensis TaxID=196024 RepID=UPI0039857ACD
MDSDSTVPIAALLAQFDYASWPRFPKREPYCRKKLLARVSSENQFYDHARQWIDKTLANIPVPEGDEYALLPRVESVCLAELDHLVGTSLLAGRWPQTEYRRYPLLYWQLVRYYQIELHRSRQLNLLQPHAGFDFGRMGYVAMLLALLGDRRRLMDCVALAHSAPAICPATKFIRPYFIETFALQLTSRFLGWGPLPLGVDLAQEPLYLALLTLWDSDDVGTVGHLLTQACHLHTYGKLKDPRFHRNEAIIGWWCYWPLEVLLVLRLRQWAGLPLPVVEHPLMAAPFDVLPPALEDPAEVWPYEALPRHFATHYPEAPGLLAQMCQPPASAAPGVWPTLSELEQVLSRGVPKWPPQRGDAPTPGRKSATASSSTP